MKLENNPIDVCVEKFSLKIGTVISRYTHLIIYIIIYRLKITNAYLSLSSLLIVLTRLIFFCE